MDYFRGVAKGDTRSVDPKPYIVVSIFCSIIPNIFPIYPLYILMYSLENSLYPKA